MWFDGIELLPFSIAQIEPHVDEIFIIYSNTSNFGTTIDYRHEIEGLGTLVNWEPRPGKPANINEIAKRNFALDTVRAKGFSHFIMMDCDEIYDSSEFVADRDKVMGSDFAGLVHRIKVYIRSPELQCNDHTLVPGVHRITPRIKYELNFKNYPYAYDGNGAHIDPTRRLNITSMVKMSDYHMHHFSHVRKNITQKMENSTARSNLTKSSLLKDYTNAAPNYYSEFYRGRITKVPNRFNIQF